MNNFGWIHNNMLNIVKKLLLLSGLGLALIGCGANNNVTFETNNGQCADGTTGSPYCMAVVIQNNSGSTGGQNFINSTNYPISQLSFSISGVSNIYSPATNPSGSTFSMDPNNCAGSTIQPGQTCTFYLQITGEAFPVQSQESLTVTINYTINNTLFGGSSNTSSASTTLYELTNLYVAQNNGNLTVYNNAWNNYGLVESADTINSMTVDTSAYGLVYLGGTLGIYNYGISSNFTSGSLSPSATFTGANNLINSGGNLFATNTNTAGGVWSYSFSGESWNSTTAVYPISGFSLQTNANAATGGSFIYLAQKNSGQAWVCGSFSGSTDCRRHPSEVAHNITSFVYTSVPAPLTGIFAGTTAGVFFESGDIGSASAKWEQVSGMSNYVTAMTSATFESGESSISAIYIGDTSGNIWAISSKTPTVAESFAQIPGASSISAMTVDANGGRLYTTAGSTIYSCTYKNCISVLPITSVTSPVGGTTNVQGMGIGSMLINTLDNLYNAGGLQSSPSQN